MLARKPKYQIFVSSTFEDLKDERQAVIEQILAMGNIPVGMERFDAANRTQWEVVKRYIEQCDYFIVIIAERYGAVDEDGKSFTRREYEYAMERGVPVSAFLLDDAARPKWPDTRTEVARARQVSEFREFVKQRMCKYWSNAGELASSVRNALDKSFDDDPRPGWIRADAVKFGNLPGDPADARKASAALADAVERDLATAGYYRRNQTVEIRCEMVGGVQNVFLTFEAELIPTRLGSLVFHPRIIRPPKGLAFSVLPLYSVGGTRVPKGGWQSIDGRTRDHLEVGYKIKKKNLNKIEDRHFWPSPVLDYTVRFVGAASFDAEVGKITGEATPDMLDFVGTKDGVKTFKGKGAAFTAQAIEWSLSKLKQAI